MKTFKVTVDGQTYNVQVEEVGEASEEASPEKVDDKGAQPSPAQPKAEPARADKEPAPVEKIPEGTAKPAPGGGLQVKAPMPGSILELKVGVGDEIKVGDVLLVLEAMKMENELTASQAGTVKEVLVKKGDAVNSGDPLLVLS